MEGGEAGGSGSGGSGTGGGGGASRRCYVPVSYELQPSAPFLYVWPRTAHDYLQLLSIGQQLLLLRIWPAHAKGLEAAGAAESGAQAWQDLKESMSRALPVIEYWACSIVRYIDYELTGSDSVPEAFKPFCAALSRFKAELLEAQEPDSAADSASTRGRLLCTVLTSQHFPAVLQGMVATICEHITEPLQQIQPALELAVSDQRILLPGFSQALSNCLTTTTFLLRTLAAADRHGTLCDNWAAFSLGGKPLIQSCSILASHVAAALAPACGLLGWDASTWQHSPNLSPRARSAVEQCVYRLTLGAVNTLTTALDLLTACSVLKVRHATGTPASASARLKKELKARKALSTISNAIDVGSSATASAGTCAAAAGCRTAVGCIVPTQQQEEQQQVQQEQQARAAAKAAKRQRQKQRKAAEAAAAAEAEQQTTGAAAEAPVGAAVEPAAPSPPLAYRPTSGASAPVAATGESEVPAAGLLHVHQAEGAAACDEAVQPAGSAPEGAVCPAASSSDQLEVLLARLGAGDAELAAGAEEQAQGSGAGSSGACLLPSPLPAVPQRPSSAAQLDALLAQLGVAGGAEGREFYSAPGRVSPSPGKAADVAGGAAAYSAAPADDDSLDALLAQLGTMQQPVVAADGNTYERSAIAAWIARQQAAGVVPRSPLTNQPLGDLSLRPNHTLRSLIAGLRAAGQL